jgi:transcriptional regulator with XRE-family HTH domain
MEKILTTTPKQVLLTVKEDLKSRRLTQLDIAKKTGYKTRQAIGSILTSGKYMTQRQARLFAKAFGYFEGFLTSGIGSLRSPNSQDGAEKVKVFPWMIFMLRPYESKEDFKKALDNLIDSAYALYGEDEVSRFLNNLVRYVSFHKETYYNDEAVNSEQKQFNMLLDKLSTQEKKIKSMILDKLFTQYASFAAMD